MAEIARGVDDIPDQGFEVFDLCALADIAFISRASPCFFELAAGIAARRGHHTRKSAICLSIPEHCFIRRGGGGGGGVVGSR